MKRMTILLLLCLTFWPMLCSGAAGPDSEELLILCYHSIQPAPRQDDLYSLSQRRFAEQMEYLRTHDYRPVALEDVIEARRGNKELPAKAVLLTFDDGYRSYADFVVPLLELYDFPSMLAVVGGWIENGPPEGLPEPLLTWPQLQKLSEHPLVTLVSHSYDLHKYIKYTPQGDLGAVAAVRAYDSERRHFETESEYRLKLENDFRRQEAIFQNRLGFKPRAMVWPYGHYNAISLETARTFGLDINLVLDNKALVMAQPNGQAALNRVMIINAPIGHFLYQLHFERQSQDPVRAVQVDLDLVCSDTSAEETENNLRKMVDRLVRLKVNTVFLQAFADPDGSGNIEEVYFRNRWLPVRADIFAHAAEQIEAKGMKVFAWMPSMSYIFPDDDFNKTHGVRKKTGDAERSGYRRLSPFSSEVRERVAELFADMATGAQISGVLFQDDAFLRDDEDFNTDALRAFSRHLGRKVKMKELVAPNKSLADEWMHFKTRALLEYLDQLKAAVRLHRPDALFARNIYAQLLIKPESEQWFAQNYEDFMDAYDYVVVMAYPFMEKEDRPIAWLEDLAAAASSPSARRKTIFKIQSYDWRRNRWIDESSLLTQMRTILGAGIRHLAYYPDNFREDKPAIKQIRLEMSTLSRSEGE